MTRDEIVQIAWDVGLFMRSHKFQDEPTKLERFAERIAAAEKELIAQWVESWGNDLTIKEIVEGIRTDGNGATRPLKYVTRDLGEG